MNLVEIEKRMTRALEKRFGQSTMPYLFRALPDICGAPAYQLIDTEGGHWIKASISRVGKRLHVWAECDANEER